MKKPLVLTLAAIVAISSSAQQPVKKVTKAPVHNLPLQSTLKTLNDSASYAIGMSIAGFCRQQGIPKLNTTLVSRSINDVITGKRALISENACNDVVNKLLMGGPSAAPKPGGPFNTTPTVKTPVDSISYAIGANHATFFKQQGLTKLNSSITVQAVNDVLGNKPLRFNERVANTVMNKILMQIQEEKVKPAIEAGIAFLEENKKRPEVKVTSTGLQYEVITEGTGIKPTRADTFVCHYRGTLVDGTKFDASYDRGQPLVLPVTSVIAGWTEGLQLMSVGSKYKFYIPYQLGYGVFGSPPVIPGGSALIFEVELLDVKKGPGAQPGN
jgi:FKBP-type peptidyl-prolyl cis-trans isomerase FklB